MIQTSRHCTGIRPYLADAFPDIFTERRQVYFSYSWVDYDTLRPGSLKLVPPDEQLQEWRADYNSMRREMFFGEVPTFEDIMKSVAEFQDGFNLKSAEKNVS